MMADHETTITAQAERKEVVVRHPADGGAAETVLQLSPFDAANRGRSVPMGVFYDGAIDEVRLLEALATALADAPVLCGRYAAGDAARVALSNAGAPVEFRDSESTLDEATAHLGAESSIFARTAHEAWAPTKAGMDPDSGDSGAPLLRARLTRFKGGGARARPAGTARSRGRGRDARVPPALGGLL